MTLKGIAMAGSITDNTYKVMKQSIILGMQNAART